MRQVWRWTGGFIREVWGRVREDNMPMTASSIAFWVLLTIVPLLLLLVSVAAFFVEPGVAQQRIEELSRELLGPGISQALREQVLSVVRNRGLLTGVALLLSLWTGSQVFIILEQAMNHLWRARCRRPFWISRLLSLVMLVLAGSVLLAAGVLVNGLRLLARLNPREFDTLAAWLISAVVPALLATAIFALIFHILPAKRVTWHSALPGAAFAGVVWTVFLHLFGLYVANVADYPVLYGSLGGLVLVMFWFYYSALIMLTGAEIAAVIHQRLLIEGDREELRAEEGC